MRLSVFFDRLPIYLDVHSRERGGLRMDWISDRNQNRWLLIISTTVQDNGPFCSHSYLQFEIRGLLYKNTAYHVENMGIAILCLNFSVSMQMRACAWFTTTFKKGIHVPGSRDRTRVVVFADPVLG